MKAPKNMYTYSYEYTYRNVTETQQSKLYFTRGGLKQGLQYNKVHKDNKYRVQEYQLVLVRDEAEETFNMLHTSKALYILSAPDKPTGTYTGIYLRAIEHYAKIHGIEVSEVTCHVESLLSV